VSTQPKPDAAKSSDFGWRCFTCGSHGPADGAFLCPECGDPRSLHTNAVVDRALLERRPASLWHYFPLLPLAQRRHIVSLGEGATPLVPAVRFPFEGKLWFKNESVNPTGSFKDRQVSVGISHARETGARTVAVVSSGNVAAATAAYAARAKMRAVLFMHGQAGDAKIAQAAAYGARVVNVDSPSPKAVFDLCLEACEKWGWYHGSTAGMYEPWNVEGAKTIAYELWHQFAGDLPDWIIAPVGGGGLLGGIYRGFHDLRRLGLITDIPRLAGVQAKGCAPLRQAIESGWSFRESLEHPWPEPDTVAGGIADDILFDGHTALAAIRKTKGKAIVVSDREILKAMRRLGAKEGLLVDACAATTAAALPHLPRSGAGASACCILTGHGLKDLRQFQTMYTPPPTIPARIEAIPKALERD